MDINMQRRREKGAAVIVHQDVLHGKRDDLRYVKVDDTLQALNRACDQYFDHVSQKMMMFGVLFKNLKPEGTAVINIDDSHGVELTRGTKARCITFGIKGEADYRAEEIQYDERGTSFLLTYNGKRYPFKTNMAAEHNVYNLLGAIASVHDAGMDMEEIREIAEHIEQIPGRLERIDEGQTFRVIVDYAHTPDGFEKVLQYAKSITGRRGKVRVVFGAAGKRDKSKRRILESISSKYGDQIYLTEQDVRNESAQSIAEQIKEGIDRGTDFL